MPFVPRPSARFLALAAAGVTLLAVGSARAAAWTSLHFSSGTSFNHTLAVGDLNGDGKRDVAVANSQLDAVTVFLGNGDGTLAAFVSYPTTADPQDVIMAELTGDAIPDLATPDYSGNVVSVLRGLGDGTFAPRVPYTVGPGCVSLAAVDLDGDGRLDLAASKESNHKVVVLPALAGGGFGAAIEVATGSFPHQINSADFDHDGDRDLAIASYGAGTAVVHLGTGTHTPGAGTPFAAGGAPAVGLSPADLNGDGDMDLLVTNVNAATVSVLLGNGDGTFASPVSYPVDPRPRGMDAGDLDGDGDPDVAVATGYPDGDSLLTLYRGLGDGTLAILAHLRLPYRAADCVIADMNGDGWPDIVTTGPQAGLVSVLLNPQGNVGVAPRSPAAGLALEIHPNPMRSAATFSLRVPGGTSAGLEIYDLSGRRVATLAAPVGDGWRTVTWRGQNSSGLRCGPGVYLARLTAGGDSVTKRLVLLDR